MQLQDSSKTPTDSLDLVEKPQKVIFSSFKFYSTFLGKNFFSIFKWVRQQKKRSHLDKKKFSKLDFWEKRLWFAFASFCPSTFRFVSFVCLFFRLVSSLERRNGTHLLLDFSSYRLYRSTGDQFSHKKYPWYECHGYLALKIDTAAMASSQPVYNAVQ